MALGAFLGDVVGGFNKESTRIRTENQARQQRDEDRAQEVLLAIANSADVRPETRSAAVTGLLTRRPGKSSGFDKWFGLHEQHPAFTAVSQLMGEPIGAGAAVDQTPQGASGQPPSVVDAAQLPPAVPNESALDALPGKQPSPAPMQTAAVSRPAAPARPVNPAMNRPSGPPPMFYTEEERTAQRAAGQTRGGIEGRLAGARNAGIALSEGDKSAIITGRMSPRNTAKLVSVEFEDGTPGSVLQYQDGTVTLENGEPLTQRIARVVPSGNLNAGTPDPSKGGKWSFVPDRPGSEMGQWVHGSATGQEIGRMKGSRTAPPAYTAVIQGSAGLAGVTRGGQAVPVPGGEDFGAAVPPPAAASAVARQYDTVVARARKDAYPFGYVDVVREKALLDQYARELGYKDFAALATAAGQKTEAVGTAVPGAPKPTPKKGTTKRDPIVDRVLQLLNK